MAGDAGRAGQVVVVVDVAIRALPRRHGVCAGQWEVHQRVIEGGRLPGVRGVALLASRGKGARHVIRIRGALKVFLMARNASRARQVEAVVQVAVGAGPGRNRVPAGQRESHRIVIKLGIQPVVGDVALFAGS